ncbi:hypothetical protein AB1Y20_013220 [Prymnesium parvum]|uniref:Isochorismatase-like domain-containing protein n=1 Tax=Prymnesium parvum TaxID=97485 RepID=A0AB34IKL2_PRYPA
MASRLGRLRADQCVFFLCDVQQKFAPVIHNFSAVVTGAQRLAEAAKCLQIPVVVTEQYPKGLGRTVDSLTARLDGANVTTFEKTEFTMVTAEVRRALGEPANAARRSVVLVGLEAHICVQQTTLDLIEMGYGVHLCVDAVSSQTAVDRSVGLHRADRAGAFLTSTESVLFELIKSKDHPQFKTISNTIKATTFEQPLSFP